MRKSRRPESLEQFEKWAVWIRERYIAARQRNGPCRPAEAPKGVRAIHCYRYFRLLDEERKIPNLAKFVKARDGARWSRSCGGGIDWVLRLIETSSEELIESGERSRLAAELKLAHTFNVQPKWIVPFLYEAGPRSGHPKLRRLSKPPRWAEKYVGDGPGDAASDGAPTTGEPGTN